MATAIPKACLASSAIRCRDVERLFRRLKGYRRIFSRFDKLDVLFLGFIHFALIFDALR